MKTKHRILSVLTVLALVASLTAVMAAPVAANGPTIAFTVAAMERGHVGTVVTLYGRGFTPGAHITSVTFAGVAVTTAPALPLRLSAIVPPPPIPGGAPVPEDDFAAISFTVPASTIGGKTIRISDGVRFADATFVVEPRVTISPVRGARDSAATATVTGFAAGRSIDVFAAGTHIGGGVTDGMGGATVPVTMRAAGAITARDGAGNPSLHNASFAFTPGITLDPIRGLGGITVTIEGRDFTPTGHIPVNSILFAGGPIGPATLITLTDRDADLVLDDFRATITIPAGATAGPKTVEVRDNVGGLAGTATVIFDVIGPAVHAITLDLTEGVPGIPVRVTGVNFPTLTWVSLRFAPRGVVVANLREHPLLASVVPTDGLGNLHPTTVTIPVVTPGHYRIWAVVRDDVTAQADDAAFEVTVPRIVMGVRDGLHAVWGQLGESVWEFKGGKWYQFFIRAPEIVPVGVRLTELEIGKAYWIYLTAPITDVHFGGARRTLSAGWHNIAWR